MLQPFDQGLFRRVKVQFGQFQRSKELSKVTSTWERVFMALQGNFITRLIWNSWSHAGIIPVINSGNCIRAELDCDRISCNPAVHHERPIRENARGDQYSNYNLESLIKSNASSRELVVVRSVSAP
jgi:hypothetical protein